MQSLLLRSSSKLVSPLSNKGAARSTSFKPSIKNTTFRQSNPQINVRVPNVFGLQQRSFSTAASELKPAYNTTELDNRANYANLLRLITAYRRYGHILADLDPLQLEKKSPLPELELSRYGLDKVAKDQEFPLPGLIKIGDKKTATLSEILDHLKSVYCNKIASEFLYLQQTEQRRWFSDKIEGLPFAKLNKDEKTRAYKLLAEAEAFDHFMQKKFPFIKRYALEGNESMMVAIDQIFASSANSGIQNIVIGMPHRGRLNFLVDLLGYPASSLFWKVKGNSELPEGAVGVGDVLSHIGQTTDLTYGDKKIHVSLLQNPSHLEAIVPVAMGKTRAKQDATNDINGDKNMCVTFHGDAAFYGQGIIPESFVLSKLSEFKTGGTIHIIVNNQLGFTTAASHGRSSRYSADIGKMIDIPVIHVNSDHPEEVVKACRVAVEFRQKFKEDIIIDLIGYRRHGHNELDEPSFTQPLMYKKIRSHPTIVKLYGEKLNKEGVLSATDAKTVIENETQRLEKEHAAASAPTKLVQLQGKWKGMIQPNDMTAKIDTGFDIQTLKKIALASAEIPSTLNIHERLKRTFALKRINDVNNNILDWATCESMSIGSLLVSGHNVRFCGQDAGRGTFSQRHLEIIDQETEERYVPLNHIQPKQGKVRAVNSPLSELAVMGYEYGYSIDDPRNLVFWEAQFGDFNNGAQIMIDQFISSGESKWLQQSGLVMLLPHGYDGAGPEHSSGRLERFLQLVELDATNVHAPNNKVASMYIANASTPANYFHLLRRQILTNFRRPLILMSPKTILRHPKAVSKFEEIAPGTSFQPVITDSSVNPDQVERVIFCSGKYYYELIEARDKSAYKNNTALVRVEELSPFPVNELTSEIKKFKNAKNHFWVQEEPQNMGAWSFVEPRFNQLVSKINFIGRPPLPASAVGTSVAHKKETETLINSVFPK